jgi:asparagine synthase (glutamine-hydrolysing)
MCGIAGYLGESDSHQSICPENVFLALSHRGPDGRGFKIIRGRSGNAFFAHTRLAIIETSSAGAQPMSAGNETMGSCVTITFNGEIYNYRELRQELSELGFQCLGGSDTEVILQAYLAWGINCFERLRGMFALAVADPRLDKVFFVRDHLGIKPFYFHQVQDGGLSFGSEVRTFRVLPGAEKASRINRDALHGFLSLGMVLGNGAFVQGVEELEPGCILILNFAGIIQEKKSILPQRAVDFTASFHRSTAIAAIRASFALSVERHLVADVPVGIFLSAGIDSTALTAVASESHPDLRTISIGFDQREADESGKASVIANHFGVHNEVVTLTGAGILADLEMVFQAMDQPTVDGFNT